MGGAIRTMYPARRHQLVMDWVEEVCASLSLGACAKKTAPDRGRPSLSVPSTPGCRRVVRGVHPLSDARLTQSVDPDRSSGRTRCLHVMLVSLEVVRDVPVIERCGR